MGMASKFQNEKNRFRLTGTGSVSCRYYSGLGEKIYFGSGLYLDTLAESLNWIHSERAW